jgi:hypothetical protein
MPLQAVPAGSGLPCHHRAGARPGGGFQPSVPDRTGVARLLLYYGVTEARRDQLMQLAVEAAGNGWSEDSGHCISADLQSHR